MMRTANTDLHLVVRARDVIKEQVKTGVPYVPYVELAKTIGISYRRLIVLLQHLVKDDIRNGGPLWASFAALKTPPPGEGICGDWFFQTVRKSGIDTGLKQNDFMREQRRLCREQTTMS